MMTLDQLKKERKLLNEIDWDMTPEEAVRLYLEWGNNWARSNYVIRSKNDVSYYFVVNTWDAMPKVYLIKRNSDEAIELAEIHMPDNLKKSFMKKIGHHKGVYSVDGEIQNWLKTQLN